MNTPAFLALLAALAQLDNIDASSVIPMLADALCNDCIGGAQSITIHAGRSYEDDGTYIAFHANDGHSEYVDLLLCKRRVHGASSFVPVVLMMEENASAHDITERMNLRFGSFHNSELFIDMMLVAPEYLGHVKI